MIKYTFFKFYNALKCSWHGLVNAFKSQWAFKVELAILIIAIPLAISFSRTATELVLMMTSVLLLPMLELLNSAIETTVNRVSMDYHELSRQAKDMASAALLIAVINMLLTWGIIVFSNLS